jgi:hypothetical protein
LVVLVVGVSGALGAVASGWFRVASVSRPGNLGGGGDEVQRVAVSGTGGEFVLVDPATFTPAFFKWDASAGEVQAGLEGLYGAGNVEVSGGPGDEEATKPYVVTFTGGLADRPVQPMLAEASEFFLSCEGATGANCTHQAMLTETAKGQADGFIVATAVNVGETAIDGTASPVDLVDVLPAGLEVLSAEGNTKNGFSPALEPVECSVKAGRTVECSFAGKLPPFVQIEVRIGVKLAGAKSSSQSGENNRVSVSGGGAPPAEVAHPILVGGGATPFGVEDYALIPEEEGGAVDTQAGSHPFQLTTTFNVKQVLEPGDVELGEGEPAGLAKDLSFRLPAGLIGNPTAVPKCTLAQFNAIPPTPSTVTVKPNECPAASVIGVANVTYNAAVPQVTEMSNGSFPIFNLEPGVGEPARFGFQPPGGAVLLDASVRTGEDYGVTVHVSNIPQTIGFLSNTVTFWGVPGDHRHDAIRGLDCLAQAAEDASGHAPCQALGETHAPPFLSLPTSCSGRALETSVSASSWANPGSSVSFSPEEGERMPELDGCGLLPFSSEIRVTPDLQAGSTPTGLKVDVHVPQEEALNGEGLAPADVKNITVKLSDGLQLNPSAADGLSACTLQEIGYKGENPTTHVQEFTPDEPSCPDSAKVATATLKLPILPVGQNVTGFVYLASPQNFPAGPRENPFGSLVAMYLVAKDPVSGILVKLPGRVQLSPSGQITATFENNPQAPFEDAEINFFGGERAPLATPPRCDSYTTEALFEPWTDTESSHHGLTSGAHFEILSGPDGASCTGRGTALPFGPSLTSQTTNINAGSFTPLVTTISREDGQQALQSVTLHYPPGISGILTGIPLCGETQANTGTCPEASQIGDTLVSVGVGGDPFTVTGGKAYLTGPYQGSPFGLSIVNPAKAGPFDLQEGRPVVVRARIDIDPSTAALTITTGSIPTVIEGFPLQVKHVNVNIDRPGFTFNPTSCSPAAITGTVSGSEGASTAVSVPFQVTNCAMLSFAPKFAVSTSGHTSKANGASLTVKLTYPNAPFGTQANITRVKVDLPKQLPSRLTTLQKACTAAQFKLNPAGCPAASIVGHAKAITPLLPVPLQGPAYFVSNGGEAFPNLIIVLQGYGVTINLVGDTFIKKGVTSNTFKTVPDSPVTSFELTLPQGKYSALAANQNLCTSKLTMPTEFAAQNGLIIHRTTNITVTGCKKPPTPQQQLAKALKACHKHKNHSQRTKCETQAHKQHPTKHTKK